MNQAETFEWMRQRITELESQLVEAQKQISPPDLSAEQVCEVLNRTRFHRADDWEVSGEGDYVTSRKWMLDDESYDVPSAFMLEDARIIAAWYLQRKEAAKTKHERRTIPDASSGPTPVQRIRFHRSDTSLWFVAEPDLKHWNGDVMVKASDYDALQTELERAHEDTDVARGMLIAAETERDSLRTRLAEPVAPAFDLAVELAYFDQRAKENEQRASAATGYDYSWLTAKADTYRRVRDRLLARYGKGENNGIQHDL